MKADPAQVNATESSVEIDELLKPLMHAGNEQQADLLLGELITLHSEPLIRNIIRHKLHLGFDQQAEADDIRQEVVLQLLAELNRFLADPGGRPVSDVKGLAAVITYRTCSQWMRRKFPERHKLKNRLHYLLTRHPSFAMWENDRRRLVAGLKAWTNRAGLVGTDQLRQASADEKLRMQFGSVESSGDGRGLKEFVLRLFEHFGAPIEFDELVGVVSEFYKFNDVALKGADDEVSIENAAAREPDAAWKVEKRIFLQRLWEEVRELPRNQIGALMLNMRDDQGRGCIALFLVLGIASLTDLADALAMEPARFAELWNSLPLEDAKIAEHLGVTRQQVINARKSARERLARRLKGFL